MHNLNETIASVWIEHNQNKIARRDCAAIRTNFLTIVVFLKNCRCWEVILAVLSLCLETVWNTDGPITAWAAYWLID